MSATPKRYFGFEKLDVYTMGLDVVDAVYVITERLPQKERFNLIDQLNRASTSITLNIAEGKGRGSNKDFIRFLMNARGSLFETVCALQICLRRKYITPEEYQSPIELLHSLNAKLNRLIGYLEKNANTVVEG